eukprot:snap_masked-scaffold_25-processed-gene-2.38-mRNA-1 protein AED:1.00 eAED:1.00 QI:0/0/0/0/1/1/2/0/66
MSLMILESKSFSNNTWYWVVDTGRHGSSAGNICNQANYKYNNFSSYTFNSQFFMSYSFGVKQRDVS